MSELEVRELDIRAVSAEGVPLQVLLFHTDRQPTLVTIRSVLHLIALS